MDKKTQDLAWRCLPKDARAEIKKYWNTDYDSEVIANEIEGIFDRLFGPHNLTSDTEPEEIICVNKERFDNFYKLLEHCYNHDSTLYDDLYWKFVECLPDKEPMGIYTVDSLIAMARDEMDINDKEPSGQVEPRFKVGDKVRKTTWDKDTTISMVEWHGTWETFVYHFKEQEYGFNCHKENDLTLVSKRAKDPDFSIGDKVQLRFDWCRLLKGTSLTIKGIPTIDRDNTFMYSFEETDEYIRETMLEPYTEPETKEPTSGEIVKNAISIVKEYFDNVPINKDNMEEKELNLLELLTGCEDGTFYCPMWGDTIIYDDIKNGYKIVPKIDEKRLKGYLNIGFDGKADDDGEVILFPSRTLYEKYPLDAKKAWDEWKSERIPKRWRANKDEYLYFITTCGDIDSDIDTYSNYYNDLYEFGNYFRTKDEANQAAEAVRECLAKFHEKNIKK